MAKAEEKQTNNKVYPSKVGLELLVPILLISGAGMVPAIKEGAWVKLAIPIGVLILVVAIFYSISYEIKKEVLVVKSFFWFKKVIPITSIRAIEETYNPISAPAASLKRLEIRYDRFNSIIISPKNRMDFIAHLKALSPSIQVKVKKWEGKS
jgi:hypothetical protein